MLITPPPYPHCVYVAYGEGMEPLYVGVTSHLFGRLYQHSSKEWWSRVKVVSTESFPTRDEADARELELIRVLQTEHNGSDNPRPLLKKISVSVEEVRAYIDAHPECMPTSPAPPPKPPRLPAPVRPPMEIPPGMTTLRAFVEREDVAYTLSALRLRSQRDAKSFPTCQSLGDWNAKLYRIDDLYAWMAVNPPRIDPPVIRRKRRKQRTK